MDPLRPDPVDPVPDPVEPVEPVFDSVLEPVDSVLEPVDSVREPVEPVKLFEPVFEPVPACRPSDRTLLPSGITKTGASLGRWLAHQHMILLVLD